MAMYTADRYGPEFGARLRAARKERGMSVDELGEKAYISSRSIWHYEIGRNLPNLVTVCNLAKVLGVNVGWLVAGE